MTKKEKILQAALKQFATDGFVATSTKSIARLAEVSEGLIFSHFENKKGLLDAINDQAEDRMRVKFGPIINCPNPKKAVELFIELPYTIPSSEYNFWRLQFMLKWDPNYYKPERLDPIFNKLNNCFKELGYKNSKTEAKFLVDIFETIAANILRDGKKSQLPYKKFLKTKYGI